MSCSIRSDLGLRHRLGGRTSVADSVSESRRAGRWAYAAAPATGSYRANPALGSGTHRVARHQPRAGQRRHRASGGIFRGGWRWRGERGPATTFGPRRTGRWSGESGWSRAPGAGLPRRRHRRAPATSKLVLGGRGTLVGEPFRAYGGRELPLAHLEWRFDVPAPALTLGSFASTGPRLTLAPFLAVGYAGRPLSRVTLGPDRWVRPVAGVALEWFMRLMRVEAGVGLRDGGLGRDGGREPGLVGPAVDLLIFPSGSPGSPVRVLTS